jgi:SecY interacting protein Syd
VTVQETLDNFINDTLICYPDLTVPFDANWRSLCETGEPHQGADGNPLISWRPAARLPETTYDDFKPLEQALEVEVHPDIKAFYAGYWAAGLEAEAVDGHVSLLFLWNLDDIERLNENLIGHALSKRTEKSPMSIFFACTDPDSELFLSVDNDSGVVLLEKPGYKPIRQIAGSLEEFLEALVPRPPEIHG